MPGKFSDPHVQQDTAPFGIQAINNQLWVTYARDSPEGLDLFDSSPWR